MQAHDGQPHRLVRHAPAQLLAAQPARSRRAHSRAAGPADRTSASAKARNGSEQRADAGRCVRTRRRSATCRAGAGGEPNTALATTCSTMRSSAGLSHQTSANAHMRGQQQAGRDRERHEHRQPGGIGVAPPFARHGEAQIDRFPGVALAQHHRQLVKLHGRVPRSRSTASSSTQSTPPIAYLTTGGRNVRGDQNASMPAAINSMPASPTTSGIASAAAARSAAARVSEPGRDQRIAELEAGGARQADGAELERAVPGREREEVGGQTRRARCSR